MLTFEHQAPARMLNMNREKHWAERARLVKTWRHWAHIHARNTHQGQLAPAIVYVTLPVPDRRRRDPHNWSPTVKAIVDGLVDAGWWPDDTPEWVAVTTPTLDVRRDHVVRVMVDEMPF